MIQKYRALVIWSTGERDTFDFDDKMSALRCCQKHEKYFRDLVEYTSIEEVWIDEESN